MPLTDRITSFLTHTASTAKSLLKLALASRPGSITPVASPADRLIIMGNGPSLADNIREDMPLLTSHPAMAVNFAANAPEFTALRPDYYLLADPHFFEGLETDPNVKRLYDRFTHDVTWPMTLFVPAERASYASRLIGNTCIRIETFSFIGIEGYGWFERAVYRSRRGMPRPRNVLVPAIMTGIWLGYKEIYILGADHSWMKTLEVDDDNMVVTVQPHFYEDNDKERKRVTSVYRNVRLHDILLSFHLAFRSYHAIAAYARRQGVAIYNSTPGSFIDAFPRRPLRAGM